MAPRKQALAQSESKKRFMERLGFDDSNPYHRRLYAMMKEEAVEGRRRMTESEGALLPDLKPGVEPPYSHAHISETAVHREILTIYQLARPETRRVYDLGRDMDRVEEENWIIRWMLWHVFRYRDNRNKCRRGNSNEFMDLSSAVEEKASKGRAMNDQKSYYWDPVRHV